jgi:hypothetical protein
LLINYFQIHEQQDLQAAPVMLRRKSAENDFPIPMTSSVIRHASSSVRVNFGAGTGNGNVSGNANDEEEEFLKPISGGGSVGNVVDVEDDDYLKPRTTLKKVDSLEDEYLKPTFGHFERIDSRDLSPPAEMPPPIPMQSYSPVKSS